MSAEYDGHDPLEPKDALRLYLDHKETEYNKNTVQAHRYRLHYFVQWCEEEYLTNLNELTGRQLQEYRLWRKGHGDLEQISLKQADVHCEGVHQMVGVHRGGLTVLRETPRPSRQAGTTASRRHATNGDGPETPRLSLEAPLRLRRTRGDRADMGAGMRLGAGNSVDAADVDFENRRLTVVQRPDQGTELENGTSGEWPVAITPELAALSKDYIEDVREPVTDEYDREPLFGTRHGRMVRQTTRAIVYKTTAPCFQSEPCEVCTGSDSKKCPRAVSPHAIRRGSITHFLTEDVPIEIVGDRMDPSRKVLKKHYDKRSEAVKLERGRGYPENI